MVQLRGVASACGSATVVNAIATGRGAAFGIELRVFAEVELREGSGGIAGRLVGGKGESPRLIEICVRRVLEHFGLEDVYGGIVETRSEVPIAVGLSSSSAAANAATLATFAALGRRPKPGLVLNLGIDAAFEAGVTITGALDDAAASLFGYGVVTDNLGRRILKRFRVDPKLKVLVHVPPAKSYTSRVRREYFETIREAEEAVHRMALRGKIYDALTLNGLLCSSALGQDPTPALEALANGALAAGMTGTGPATVALAEPEAADAIERAWRARPGRVIKTKPAVKGGGIERP
jgi:shikimate kinase